MTAPNPPLAYFRDVRRADFDAAMAQVAAVLRRGGVYQADVAHDADCPCAGNRAPMPACRCERVDITVWELTA